MNFSTDVCTMFELRSCPPPFLTEPTIQWYWKGTISATISSYSFLFMSSSSGKSISSSKESINSEGKKARRRDPSASST